MIKEAIDRILDLKSEDITLLDGRYYNTRSGSAIKAPLPVTIIVRSLDGLIVGIKELGLTKEKHFIEVSDDQVEVVEKNLDVWARRSAPLGAKIIESDFEFNNYYSQEDFLVAVMTNFTKTPEILKLLAVASNLSSGKTQDNFDDGVSQTVEIKAGVSLKAVEIIKNPIKLRPYRTFHDIQQPESDYIFRVKVREGREPQCALFASDSDFWKLQCMKAIKAHLSDKTDLTVVF